MSESEFRLEKEPVRGRDQSAVKMIAGLSMGEILVILLGTMFIQMFFKTGIFSLAFTFGAYGYFRHLKSMIPDNFFQNAARFYLREHEIYRSGGRDYEWRPPISSD